VAEQKQKEDGGDDDFDIDEIWILAGIFL
jgi:hypothetical protein